MSRFVGKTYSRAKDKESLASRAFDDLFDDGRPKTATRTAATSQKWGKTTFTSVRDSRPSVPSPDSKRRKVSPVSPSSDPFTFESSDEGGISPKKNVKHKQTSVTAGKKLFSSDKQTTLPFAPAPVNNSSQDEDFRPVKRFFRTHKGFLEKPVSSVKPQPPPIPKLRVVMKKKPTSDNELAVKSDLKDSQDSSTSGIFLSSSDPDWLKPSRDSDHVSRTSDLSSASDISPSFPSKCNITDRTKSEKQSAKVSVALPNDSSDVSVRSRSSKSWKKSEKSKVTANSQNSDSLGAGAQSNSSDSTGPITRGPPRLYNSLTKHSGNSNSGRGTPSPPTLNVMDKNLTMKKATVTKAEVTLEDGEFVFNDDDLVVIRGSEESSVASKEDCAEEKSSQETVQLSQGSDLSTPNNSQDSPSSQGATNKRLLLKKHLTDSPKRSPAKRYNPRQWIQDGSSTEKSMARSASLPPSQSARPSAAYNFDDESTPLSLSRQPRSRPRLGVQAALKEEVMAVKVTREHKELYTVVQNVKDVHECQEHGETQEFQDDIAYLLDGLNDTQTVTTRCLSTLSLANKCIEPVFRMHLRAHGTVTRIFTALKDASHNPCLAMSTSLIMFMLSRDRLSVDVDQDGMEMMINLLNADVKHRKMKPGMVKDYQRIKQRVQDVIAQLKKDGGAKNMELSEISTSNLATETLLALSSRRSGDAFKEEMRSFGGLDHIVDIVSDCTDSIDDDDIDTFSDVLIDTLKKIDRCLRVLENVTYLNSDNQTYLISYSSSSLINSLCNLLRITERVMELYPAPEPVPEPEKTDEKTDNSKSSANEKPRASPPYPSQMVFQCMLSVLRVLLNITHDNVWGSQKVGQTDGLMSSALMCALHVPQFAPAAERFDLLVLSLGMIINLVEHCEMNRRLLMNTETVAYYDSQDRDGQREAVEALTQLFLQKESAACQLDTVMTAPTNKTENNTDQAKSMLPADQNKTADESGEWQENDSGLLWVIGKKKKTKKNQNEDDESDDEEQHIEIIPSSVEDEENFTKALHKAGKHMEDSIVAAYVALLLGCIIKENSTLVEKVREHLPDGSFEPMVNILTKFLGFMNLTSGVAAQHSSKSIVEIIQIMDKL